jgi:ATP-binding cassette subfamily C protein
MRIGIMKKYILREKKAIIFITFMTIIVSFLNVSFAFLLKYIIDISTNGTLDEYLVVVISCIIITLVFCIVKYFVDYLKNNYIRRTMKYIKSDIVNQIFKKNIYNFNENKSSNYISILTNDMVILENDLINSIFILASTFTSFLIGVFALFKINVYVTILAIIISVLTAVIPMIFAKKIGFFKQKLSKEYGNYTHKVKDIFNGFEIIKTFNLIDIYQNIFDKSNIELEMRKYNMNQYIIRYKAVTSLLNNFTVLGIFLIGGYFILTNRLTAGSTIASLQLISNIILPVAGVGVYINTIKSNSKLIERINKIIAGKEKSNKKSINELNKGIKLNELCFFIGKKQILKNVSIEFEINKKYVIVGESGSGKSTLLKVLLGYYDSYNGEIFIDNLNLKDINDCDLYNLISIIHQNVYMFDDTIENNIILYENYLKNRLNSVSHKVNLNKITEDKKDGINYVVGENGVNLSGGEKQRISIARAIIREPEVLLLDEATSALDGNSSSDIDTEFFKLKNKLSIVITHKLNKNILEKYDEIIVMKNGEIAEKGSFEELLLKKGVLYNMYIIDKKVS